MGKTLTNNKAHEIKGQLPQKIQILCILKWADVVPPEFLRI